MSDILQIPSCGGVAGTFNSGIPSCDVLKGIPLGLIGLDAGVGFNAAQRATVAAFMAEFTIKSRAARGSRAYPFWRLTNFEDKSKEPTRAAAGNLSNAEAITIDGIPAFAFQHRIGEIFHNKLLSAQNSGCTWMIVDKNYVVYGTIDAGLFRGFTVSEFYVGLSKFATPSAFSIYPFEMTISDQTEYKENGRFVQLSSSLVSVSGIRDVVLEQFSMVGSVLKVKLTALGGKNMTDLFATELAQSAAWDVKDAVGAAVTVSAAFDSTNGVMSLTLSGVPWTGAATNDAFTANLVSAAALKALASPIDGYESTGALAFTKP